MHTSGASSSIRVSASSLKLPLDRRTDLWLHCRDLIGIKRDFL
jgi:hypothetical protein